MPAAEQIAHGPTERRGWLVPLLVEGDPIFGHNRIDWWCRVEMSGALPPEPIPPIHWREVMETTVRENLRELSAAVAERDGGPPLSPAGALKHLYALIDAMGGGWECLTYLIRWLAHGLAVGQDTARPRAYGSATEEWDALLYKRFELGRLQAADADVLGWILSEQHGKGVWNKNAYFPTPSNVCHLMAEIVMGGDPPLEDGRDVRLASVLDPCVGTGRMLMAASNRSVNLYGVDIDGTMVDACAVNGALFVPWLVYLGPRQRKLLGRPGPTYVGDQRLLAQADVARQEQGHPPLPVSAVRETVIAPSAVYEFDRHGQGDLFSVPLRKGAAHDE
jgi:hypothetical protein